MPHYTLNDILELPSLERMHLINSSGGLKSGNLIGTISETGTTNLAVFNSVIHLGSKPPMLSFMLRPLTVKRHTYKNFKNNHQFTVNHIHHDFIEQAHQTSAKYSEEVSEFEAVNLTEEYIDDFKAPFVKESLIKLGCSYVNEYHIKEHDCRLIIGQIEHLIVANHIQDKDGFIDLSKANTAGIIGLDGYVKTEPTQRFAYAKPNQELKPLKK